MKNNVNEVTQNLGAIQIRECCKIFGCEQEVSEVIRIWEVIKTPLYCGMSDLCTEIDNAIKIVNLIKAAANFISAFTIYDEAFIFDIIMSTFEDDKANFSDIPSIVNHVYLVAIEKDF